MITFNDLSYHYPKGPEALSGVTATIPPGLHLLMGENGAGKTTLLHIIAGLLYPTAGSVEVNGFSPRQREPKFLNDIFFLGDEMTLPGGSVMDFGIIAGAEYPEFDCDILSDYLERFGLTGGERLEKLSLGNRRKSLVALALSLGTSVVLLDEPANGLDIASKEILGKMLAESAGDDRTIIVSTHVTQDFNNMFDGVISLRRNRLQLAATLSEILDAIAFTADMIPPVKALFTHQSAGHSRSIVEADQTEDCDIDYRLLHLALQSPAADEIILRIMSNKTIQQP